MSEPVSIRTNNPGAMWGGNKRAAKWGATADLVLNDGQANHIAVFPDKVHGAAAQFDLWRASYTGLTLLAAIHKWSGGNSSAAYEHFLEHTGIQADTILTAELLAGPKGLALMKAQAQWEAGKPYPMSDAEWATAQAMVFQPVLRPGDHAHVPLPKPRPPVEPEQAPQLQPDDPGPAPEPDAEPEPHPAPARTQSSLWRRITNAIGALGASAGALTFDWRLGAVLFVAAALAVVFLLWLFGKDSIRAWIRRHLA